MRIQNKKNHENTNCTQSVLVLYVILLTLVLAACSHNNPSIEKTAKVPSKIIPIAERNICVPSSEFKLGDIEFGMSHKQVLKLLGKPGPRSGSLMWLYPQVRVNLDRRGMVVGLHTNKPTLDTPSGIKVGMEQIEIYKTLRAYRFMPWKKEIYIKNCPDSAWDAWLYMKFSDKGILETIGMKQYNPCMPLNEYSLGGFKPGMKKETILHYLGPPERVEGYTGVPTHQIEDIQYAIATAPDAIETLVYSNLMFAVLKPYNIVMYISTASPMYSSPSGIKVGMDEAVIKKLLNINLADTEALKYPIEQCPSDSNDEYRMWLEFDNAKKLVKVAVGFRNLNFQLRLLGILPKYNCPGCPTYGVPDDFEVPEETPSP